MVHRYLEITVECRDWRALPADERHRNLKAFLKEDRLRGFELSRAPVMRLTLMRLAEGSHYFVWSYHHLMLDGWSVFLLLAEALALYEAFRSGRELRLPPPPPYRDFIVWLQQRDLESAEKYWRQALAGFSEPTVLGIDRAASGRARQDGERLESHSIRISAETLRSFVRRHGLTLNTLVQGVWGLLLKRYSGREDVVFGAVTSGRPPELPGFEQMIGLFINSHPVRLRASGSLPFATWLKNLQAQQATQRRYEHTPLIDIQRWSDVPRGQPLFESVLGFENFPLPALGQGEGASLEVHRLPVVERTNYPLTLSVYVSHELQLDFYYDRRRFDRISVVRLLKHFRGLLEGGIAYPERRPVELPLLTAAERHQVLVEWNDTRVAYPPVSSIHRLFEARVASQGDAVAVIHRHERLTYRELDRRATRLAHHLRSLGVGAGGAGGPVRGTRYTYGFGGVGHP